MNRAESKWGVRFHTCTHPELLQKLEEVQCPNWGPNHWGAPQRWVGQLLGQPNGGSLPQEVWLLLGLAHRQANSWMGERLMIGWFLPPGFFSHTSPHHKKAGPTERCFQGSLHPNVFLEFGFPCFVSKVSGTDTFGVFLQLSATIYQCVQCVQCTNCSTESG